MSEQTMLEQIRWQDLQVRSEVDIVLEIAKEKGWEDCEVFGYGAMITEPQESKGWKLIPADLYKDSIPPQAVERLHQIINAGIRVRGVIIADDKRSTDPAPVPEVIPAPAPARPKVSLSFVKPIITWTSQAALGILHSVGTSVSLLGKVMLVLIRIAAIGALIAFGVYALVHFFWPTAIVGFVILMCAGAGTSTGTSTSSRVSYDPKLVILVDNGTGNTTWVSLFTWYD